jgi:N-acetylglucosaminyl-diphospho-decaprenol L-rhamnosyltransferase
MSSVSPSGPLASDSQAGTRFAVIIVNYNGGDLLKVCAGSVLAEGVYPSRILVVDNGSRDQSIEDLLERYSPGPAGSSITVLRNGCNAGFSRAVNQGIRHALAEAHPPEFVLLLNNDAQLDPGALHAFAEGFDSRPTLAIAGGQLRYPDGRLQSAFAPLPSLAEEILPRFLLRLIAGDRFRRKSIADQSMPVESVLGACIAVRAATLPRLGLLDEDFFFFFEEIEWCRRAHQLGFNVVYLPQARAIHGQGQTADRFRGPARVEYQRSKLNYFRKTRSLPAYLLLSAVLVLRTLINALAGAVACLATLCLNRRIRSRTHTYWYLIGWHLLLRPSSWGLPDKCPGDHR